MTHDKETIRAAYIEEIGYDPFENDPSVTVEQAGAILLECRSYFVDLDDPNYVGSRHHY
jgi:hypothetical protein